MSSERASTLGAHLEELDRLLYDVQAELAPDRNPRPVLVSDAALAIPDPATTRSATADPAPRASAAATHPGAATAATARPALDTNRQIEALTELSERLVASMRELLDGYERILVPKPRPRAEPAGVTLLAGPFASIEALREFEAAVSQLRGVREVTVRGYEGTDRAIIDVRLA